MVIKEFPPEVCIASCNPDLTWADRYVLVEEIGAGGTSEVWKAWDTVLGRWIALKILHAVDAQEMARFSREAMTAARMSHPHIAALYEIGEHKGRHFLAMQYVDGVTLQEFPRGDRRLLIRLVRDAARAVGEAHRNGIVHRDLKPANLMVSTGVNPPQPHVFVLDFGLARGIRGEDKLTASGIVAGTPAYMAPEQARGEEVDGRADVYGLGATLYELATGEPAFQGTNVFEVLGKLQEQEPQRPRRIDPKIDRDLETIILKCLEKTPDRRFRTADEVADDLDRYLQGDPIRAKPPSTVRRMAMRLAKRKALAGTTAAALIAFATLALILLPWIARERAWARARLHVDLARSFIDRMDRLEGVDEDSRAELAEAASKADAELQRALGESPLHHEALFERGRLCVLLGRESDAVASFTNAIDASPFPGPAHFERALLRLEGYERLQHQAAVAHTAAGSPGFVTVERGRHRPGGPSWEADALATELRQRILEDLSKSNEGPRKAFVEGLDRFTEGRYEESAERLEAYVKAAPADWRGWMWRGHALMHADQPRAALENLTRALEMRPRDAVTLRLRAMARGSMKPPIDAARRSPWVAIVPNFPDPAEIGAIQCYLSEAGLDYQVFNQSQLTFENIREAGLVIWNDLGFSMTGITDREVDVLSQAHQAGIPLYFIGDDLAYSVGNLKGNAGVWSGLLHLRPGGNATSIGEITIASTEHPVIRGPKGAVQSFTYSGDPDDTEATSTGETVLAASGTFAIILAYEDSRTGARTVTQNVMVFNDTDVHGVVERKKLFLNSIAWLLASSPGKSRPDW